MTLRRLAIGLATTTFVSAAGALALYVLSQPTQLPDFYGFRGDGAVLGVISGAVGLAIGIRQPRNAVGWIFLVSGSSLAIAELCDAYAIYALLARDGAIAGGAWAAWVGAWLVKPALLTQGLLAFFFPDGRLLSVKWRAVVGFCLAVIVLEMLWGAGLPGPLRNSPFVMNPVGAFPGRDLLERLDAWRSASLDVSVNLPFILALIALVVRFRRSRGLVRLQMKWITYALVLLAITVVLQPIGSSYRVFQIASVILGCSVPVAAGIAILRYRLYDIDLLINRTLVYGLTTATLGAAFFGGIVLLQTLLSPFTGGNELAVAASTLVSFALFQPVRARVQATVDRRFYRSRYDAARTIDRFTSRLSGEVDLDMVRADLLDAVANTVQPLRASLWLRGPGV